MGRDQAHNKEEGEVTSLCKPFPGLLVEDVLLLTLPQMSPEDREYVAWEHTGWPCFFDTSGSEWHPSQVFYRQLKEFNRK